METSARYGLRAPSAYADRVSFRNISGRRRRFFQELLGGAAAARSLHGIVNGFLWYKGAKEISAAIADAAGSSAVSTAGIGMWLVAETLWHSAMFSGAVGIGGRLFLGRLARSRWGFAKFISNPLRK